jgi:hypothetical protein
MVAVLGPARFVLQIVRILDPDIVTIEVTTQDSLICVYVPGVRI